VLTKVTVAELPLLLGTIRKNRAEEAMMELAIVCSAMNPKLAKKIVRKLSRAAAQLVTSLPSVLDGVSEETRKRIEEVRKRTRKKDA